MEKASKLKSLHKKWFKKCTCALRYSAIQGVPGEGNAEAKVVFIGEAPGAKEDREGRPFIGASGKFLVEMLASIKMKREDVYITSIVKYRPPENRDPTTKEIADCAKWLEEEIKLIDPLLIVFLGRYSMNHFFHKVKISEAHGELLTGYHLGKTRNFLPLYHPAAALYNGSMRETLKRDFKKILRILKKLEN